MVVRGTGDYSGINHFEEGDTLSQSIVEIVTPRSSESFMQRLVRQDHTLDYLCLELSHWGFNEAINWAKQVRLICDNNPEVIPPSLSLHGFPDDMTDEMIQSTEEVSLLWMSREDQEDWGKDCATILREMILIEAATRKQYGPQWRDPEPLVEEYNVVQEQISDEEFDDLIKNTMRQCVEIDD